MSKTEKMIVAKAQVDSTFFGLQLWLESTEQTMLKEFTKPKPITLAINSKSDEQRDAACQSLNELMNALNLTLPELAKRQPAQVVAATYARLINTVAYDGGLLTVKPKEAKVLEVTTETGISKHHKKKYTNYHFKTADEQAISQKDFDKLISVNSPEWRIMSQLQDAVTKSEANKLPEDFLLWFDSQGKDRGDYQDIALFQQLTHLNGKELVFAFYQIKFELADVLTYTTFHNHISANLPAGIFIDKPGARYDDCLAGMLILYARKNTLRPNATEILRKSVEGKLPNKEWNGQWEN